MIRGLLAESAGPFWHPAEFENVANPDFENLKNLQNPGHLSLTKPIIYTYTHARQRKFMEMCFSLYKKWSSKWLRLSIFFQLTNQE